MRRRREDSASRTPPWNPYPLEDGSTPLPDGRPTPYPTKIKVDLKSKEMKTPEKYVTKGGRISSLMQQDSAYRKPPTPFPDPERVDFESRRRRSKSRITDTKSSAHIDNETTPKPPVTPYRPPEVHHRLNRPKCGMSKIDLTFTTSESPLDYHPLDETHEHCSHTHADRSRTYGMTYLEKAYLRPGVNLPDIKDNNRIISGSHGKSSNKPSIINLDLPDEFEVTSKSEIMLPGVNRKPMTNQDTKNLPASQQGLPPKPPRKPAVKRFKEESQEPEWRIWSPRPPKPAAAPLSNNVAHAPRSPPETIEHDFEKLPALNQQTTTKNNWVACDEELAAAFEWTPKQRSTVEHLPDITMMSPQHFSPTAYENRNTFPSEEDPADAIIVTGYGSSPPRIRKGEHSEYTPHTNRVMYHEEKLNDVEVDNDGTMLIGLDDMHISPSPTDMTEIGQVKKPIVLPTPKKLSITDQITNFKDCQTTGARDARARIVQAEVAWRCERRLGDLKEEEDRKFKEQKHLQELTKAKPPHRVENMYVPVPPKAESHFVVAPPKETRPGQQQLPASLRKRRQPRMKKDW